MSDFAIGLGGISVKIPAREQRVYDRIETKGHVWYVARAENSGDSVYVKVKNENPKNYFKGYGGSTLDFKLSDGSVESVKGPWHSNADSLFADTGIDLRDKYLTFGVISMGREHPDGLKFLMKDVIYLDEDWTIGPYERVNLLAQEMANQLLTSVFVYVAGQGGSSCGRVEPKK